MTVADQPQSPRRGEGQAAPRSPKPDLEMMTRSSPGAGLVDHAGPGRRLDHNGRHDDPAPAADVLLRWYFVAQRSVAEIAAEVGTTEQRVRDGLIDGLRGIVRR